VTCSAVSISVFLNWLSWAKVSRSLTNSSNSSEDEVLSLVGDSYQCVLTRKYIFNLRFTEEGTNAEKLQKAIENIQISIANIGIVPEMSKLTNCIEKII